MIVDYRKKRTEHAPILIDRAALEQSFKFFGVLINNKLTWSNHTPFYCTLLHSTIPFPTWTKGTPM